MRVKSKVPSCVKRDRERERERDRREREREDRGDKENTRTPHAAAKTPKP